MINFHKYLLVLIVCFYSFAAYAKSDSTIFSEDSLRYFIDNGIIRVGFDKRMGGMISYFERKTNGHNLINNHDAGRQAGFETRIYPSNPSTWKPYPNSKYLTDVYPYAGGASREWNGLPQGSFYNEFLTNIEHLGGPPEKIDFDEGTGILYIKSKLWEWGFVNEVDSTYKKIDSGAYNECWVNLEGIAANFSVKQVRNIPFFVSNTNLGISLNVFINLNFPFATKWQTYNTANPYTNRPVDIRTSIAPNEPNYENIWHKPTENWVAMTSQEDFGMGIYTKDSRFNFLYAEKQYRNICPPDSITCPDERKYSFGTFSFSTYSFPCGQPCTAANNSTTLNYTFLAGTVTEIRQYAYDKRTSPCDNSLVLSSVNDDLTTNTTKKTRVLIEANNKITNATSTYRTGKSIVLNPGFKVLNGASFKAEIVANPCN